MCIPGIKTFQISGEEIRGRKMELQEEIEEEGNYRTGIWAVSLEEEKPASPPDPTYQPQKNVKVYPVWPGNMQ